ncbi:MAG: GTPase [Candidatus Heimdallarchaeota archaeon]
MPSTNPFRAIVNIPTAKQLYSKAETQAMKKSVRGVSESVPPLQRSRKMEAARIEQFSKEIRSRLFQIVSEFPRLEAQSITGFYFEILDISFGVDNLRKTLGSLSGAANVVWRIRRQHLGQVWHARSVLETKIVRRAAFGRIRSVVQKLDKRLHFLETVRGQMRSMPGIDLNLPTFCVVGYPNVGKSSLVKGITAASPEIGAYPFTTKEVTLGHLEIPLHLEGKSPAIHLDAQLVDTPGILDRPLKDRNEIELRAIAAMKTLATAMIFLFDFTQQDALEAQRNLLEQVFQEFKIPIIVLGTKADRLEDTDQMNFEEYWQKTFPHTGFPPLISISSDPKYVTRLIIEFFHKHKMQIQQTIQQRTDEMRGQELWSN